ncbi:MAG: SDR family oxidoreductase [Anaerolineae bacterium]|nr:SDR family oxidoreductase [Anaerolineae bacterium]
MGRVENKVAIVTGGAMGIGKAAAAALAREGAKVAIGDINETEGQKTAAEIQQKGGEVFFQKTDVSVSASVQQLVEATVARYGKLDVLVNNVGVAIPGSAADISEEDWNKVININLGGVWRGIKYAIPHLIKNGKGSIINTSSVQALVGFKGWSGYAASKGAIISLTQQVAIDYAPYEIRVNAIAPGTIMTPMNEKIFEETPDRDALIRNWNEMHPIGRFGQPEEVGELILFLASDESSFITGEVIRVDGGVVVKGG